MIKIFERHAQHLGWQSLRQLAAVLRIEPKSVLRELRLCHLPRAAKFAVDRGFDDDTRRLLVGCLRNFKMHIAVSRVYAGFLHECISDVKHLEFAAGPRSIRGYEGVLGPTQNGIDTDLLRGNVRDRHVLGNVPEVGDVWFNWDAFTEIFGRRLQNSVVAAFARACGEPQEYRAA